MANMKKIIDERAKHRLVGVIVVLALMIIILPAMMRESDKNFDEFTSYHAPKPPSLPKVSRVDQHEMLRSVKVVSVALPKPGPQTHLHIAPAQSLSPKASQDELVQAAKVASQKQQKHEASAMKFYEVFAIQLASFNNEANAQALIHSLQAQGFPATQQIVKNPKGMVYQVIVGRLRQRDQAIDLQKKLVDNTQLNGLIIKTRVS